MFKGIQRFTIPWLYVACVYVLFWYLICVNLFPVLYEWITLPYIYFLFLSGLVYEVKLMKFSFFYFDVYVYVSSSYNICSNVIYLSRLCIGSYLIFMFIQSMAIDIIWYSAELIRDYLKSSVILYLFNLGRTATCKRSRKEYKYSQNSKFTIKKDKKLISEL